MKLICLLVSPIVLAAFLPTKALRRPLLPGKESPSNATLQLTTNVVRQELCENGGMRIWLLLHFTNTGTEPIILERFSAAIVGYTISRDEKAAAKGDYEDNVHVNRLVSTAPNPTHGRTPPENQFVILKSRESYDVDAKFAGFLLIRTSDVRRFGKGNHVLRLRVSTWDEPVVLAEELSVAWRKYGVLWWQGVTSLPMPLKIEKPSSGIKCS